MSISISNHHKHVHDILADKHSAVIKFAESDILNVRILKNLKNGTIVRLSSRSNPALYKQMTVNQNLDPGRIYNARFVGDKPIFTETVRTKGNESNHSVIDAILGKPENTDADGGLFHFIGGIFGLNDTNHINMEEKRRNCVSFSDSKGQYYFIFKLPVDEIPAKFVIRIDSRLDTFVNIYISSPDELLRESLCQKMSSIQTALTGKVSSLNYAVFSDFELFRQECETQLGLNEINLLG